MVNAVNGGSKPASVKKPEEKKKKPESQTPAPAPAPAEKPNTGNTGSQDVNLPKDGLDPKAAFQVSQRLNTKSTGDDEAAPGSMKKGDAPGKSRKEDTAGLLQDVMNPDDKKDTKETGNGNIGMGEPAPTEGEGEDKKPKEKPEEEPITRDSALQYAYTNFDIFDTGAGIGDSDNKFSIKDLNALKDSNVKEVAENAQKLIYEDIIGELGGGDGKISREDIENNFVEDFDIKEKYENITIDESTFSEDELKTLNKHLAFMANDPDGQKLLEQTNSKEGGFTFKKDADAAAEIGAAAYVQGNELVLSSVEDKGNFLSLLTHEMTHAASEKNGKSNEEALGSVLGHRLWSRYYGDHDFTKDNGDEVTFDGSKEAEEMVFIEELKKRGDGTEKSYDAGSGDRLRSLGFEFGFDTNVSKFDDDKPVYSEPEDEKPTNNSPKEGGSDPGVAPGAAAGSDPRGLMGAIEDLLGNR